MKNLLYISLFLLCQLYSYGHSHENNSPVEFIPNYGQWEQPFLYKGLTNTVEFYIENDGVKYIMGDEKNPGKVFNYKYNIDTVKPQLLFHAYKMKWIGSKQDFRNVPSKKQTQYHNYYISNDSTRWKTNVPLYHQVDFQNLYDGIDINYYSDDGQLKYDFIVNPGGNPADIRFTFDGIDGIQLVDGNIVITTSVGQAKELRPYAYQYIQDKKIGIPVNYVLENGIITFKIGKQYNRNYTLVIDPVVEFSSLTGSRADNWGFTATYDAAGNLYAAGIVSGNGYPTTTGAYSVTYRGGNTGTSMPSDVVISKFNSTGNILLYSTYLGSLGNDEPHSIIVDYQNNLIISGKTDHSTFPTTSNSYDPTFNGGIDLFITKFNNGGTQLLASTYLGGSENDGVNIQNGFIRVPNSLSYNYGDNYRGEVNIDRQNNIYLVGQTQSSNFPTTANAIKRAITGSDQQDGFIVKFNSGLSNLIYSSLLGGNSDDAAYVVTLDKSDQFIYVAGGTASSDFLSTTRNGAYLQSFQGGISDGFITKINNSNYNIVRSTYIGTNSYDQIYGIQLDDSANIYVMGQTEGNYPVSNNVYNNANGKQFIHKLNTDLNQSRFSTVFGTGGSRPDISLVTMLVDTCENIYISGWGGNAVNNFGGTTGLPITNDALQRTTDGNDFYFIVFNKNAQNLLYASFFGAAGKGEHVDGGTSRFDPSGVIYQTMCASCGGGTSYPSTPGAYSTVNGSPNCNMGVVKLAFNLGSVKTDINISGSGNGCAPLTVNFGNNSSNVLTYEWDFGDGSPISNVATPSHVYVNPGTYQVRLIGINPNACNERDTSYLTINVSEDTMRANFNYRLIDSCTNYTVSFNNLTTAPSNNTTYRWEFGDGNTSSVASPTHNYSGPGTYNVMLIAINPDACNNPDTIIQTLNIINNYVKADIVRLDTFCTSDILQFNSNSYNATSHLWNFGDGNSSNDTNPTHQYTQPGTYYIEYVAFNMNSCNGSDTLTDTVVIQQGPVVDFSYTPLTPELNSGTQFRNHTQLGDTYSWDFGDGQSSNQFEPYHNYIRSGQYEVCLSAKNLIGCENKTCKFVSALVQNVAEVPSAFSPNGDGKNDRLYVRGYNIESIEFKIFNRWGQLVYESTDIEEGWDGYHNGKLAEMDAFAYQVNVVFKDGEKKTLQGNVTILL